MNLATKLSRYTREAYQLGHFPSTLEALTSKKPKLAYFGFLGDQNLGDEMVYWAAKELFHDCLLVPIKRRSPVGIKIASRDPASYFDGIVQGGGTLINGENWGPSRKQFFSSGLPIYVHGTGVLDANPSSDWNVLSQNIFGGVRGPISKSWINETVDLPIVGDAALALNLEPQRAPVQNRTQILINLGTHEHNQYRESEQVEDQLIAFCKRAISEGFEIAFLPFHRIDSTRARGLRERLPELQILKQPTNLAAIQKQFDGSSFAVGERLHFIVSAALFRCPFLSINYARKHHDFLNSIALESQGAEPSEITSDRIFEAFRNRDRRSQEKAGCRVTELRELQRSLADRFQKLFTAPSG